MLLSFNQAPTSACVCIHVFCIWDSLQVVEGGIWSDQVTSQSGVSGLAGLDAATSQHKMSLSPLLGSLDGKLYLISCVQWKIVLFGQSAVYILYMCTSIFESNTSEHSFFFYYIRNSFWQCRLGTFAIKVVRSQHMSHSWTRYSVGRKAILEKVGKQEKLQEHPPRDWRGSLPRSLLGSWPRSRPRSQQWELATKLPGWQQARDRGCLQ